MATIDGGTLLLRTLEALGVEHLFQVLGDPLAPIAMANLRQGPTAYNFRHEQAAAMAAQALSGLMMVIRSGAIAIWRSSNGRRPRPMLPKPNIKRRPSKLAH